MRLGILPLEAIRFEYTIKPKGVYMGWPYEIVPFRFALIPSIPLPRKEFSLACDLRLIVPLHEIKENAHFQLLVFLVLD